MVLTHKQNELESDISDEDQFEYDEKYEQQEDLDEEEEDFKENEDASDLDELEESDEDVVVQPKKQKKAAKDNGKATNHDRIDVCGHRGVIRYALTHGTDKYRRRKRSLRNQIHR